MTTTSSKRLGALALGAVLVLSACSSSGASTAPSTAASTAPTSAPASSAAGSPAAAGVAGSIIVSGSSTVEPISSAIAEAFKKANPDFNYKVTGPGTGDGFKTFCAGDTDISDASRKIKDDSKAATCSQRHRIRRAADRDRRPVGRREPGQHVRELPDRGPAQDHLRPGLAQGPALVARSIPRSRPRRSSGSCPAPTPEPSTTSPRSINGEVDAATQNATQSEDDNTLVTGVAGSQYAIGFFGFAYYVENTDKLKAVEVDGGKGAVASPRPTRRSTTTPTRRSRARCSSTRIPRRRRHGPS